MRVFEGTNGTKYEYMAGATTEAKHPPNWAAHFTNLPLILLSEN
jgi:hypothetical protein